MLLLFEKEIPNIAPNIVFMTFIDQLRKITYITVLGRHTIMTRMKTQFRNTVTFSAQCKRPMENV